MTHKRLTLGPKSKSVLIQKQYGAPIVCNDSVTIAKEMSLSDAAENLGAQMLRQAAEKTGTLVGDGTSTATILAHALFADGVRNVTAGASAIDIKRALDRSLKVAVDEIKTLSRSVRTRNEKAQVATISAHNDPTIGELVAPAMDKVGGDGVIAVDESKTTETVLEVVEGMQFDRGYLSPYFESTGDERTGVQIFKHALEAPTRQIAENSAVDGGVVVSKMLERQGNVGFDAARKQYVDLLEAGIVDPTKVVRIALENAVSVAGILLLTEATMTEKPDPGKRPRPLLSSSDPQVFKTERDKIVIASQLLCPNGIHWLLPERSSSGVERSEIPLPPATDDDQIADERRRLAFGCVDWFMYGDSAPPEAPRAIPERK